MLETLEVQNFRSIRSIKLKNLKRINLLVGQNNCGKTTILEALFLNLAIFNPDSFVIIHNMRGLRINGSNDFRFIFYGLDYKNTPKIITSYSTDVVQQLILSITISDSQIPNLTSDMNSNIIGQNIQQNTSLEYIVNISQNKKEICLDTYSLKFNPIENTFTRSFNHDNFHKFNSPCYFMTSHRIDNDFTILKTLNNIFINNQKEDFIQILQIIDSNIKDIHFGSNNMIYLNMGLLQTIPIELTGDGVCKLFALMLRLYHCKDSFFIVDEIENGLHYSSLKKIAKALYVAAEKFNVQLFIVTHNEEVLQYFTEAANEDITFQENLNCYNIVKYKDGTHDGLPKRLQYSSIYYRTKNGSTTIMNSRYSIFLETKHENTNEARFIQHFLQTNIKLEKEEYKLFYCDGWENIGPKRDIIDSYI